MRRGKVAETEVLREVPGSMVNRHLSRANKSSTHHRDFQVLAMMLAPLFDMHLKVNPLFSTTSERLVRSCHLKPSVSTLKKFFTKLDCLHEFTNKCKGTSRDGSNITHTAQGWSSCDLSNCAVLRNHYIVARKVQATKPHLRPHIFSGANHYACIR
ncbi:hypothetical protein AUEXF2481DRAFT_39946 [Aureobasidium subglaciale EXF-2481]|uniref:Uncharacterized protein n=1 Tax=Aureobasidium subglaciale (strain EXF-2481) TaxID=1043005 RepID=A0A074Z986_AURSE|nr:uncharacterized protein AUEXF2481DRAFT_39946 [Aureobasidium subglaciale EXF-2481]KEQ95396.1 hypothetical protein AUEXF2481DRAFT_39946 [Aureobasidium subglaciale EXF-2481]